MAAGKKKRDSGAGGRRSTPEPAGLVALRDQVEALLQPVVAAQGVSLEGVVIKVAGARTLVRVVVDLPADEVGAMSLDQVSDAARAVSAALDQADPITGGYTVEVSTPGTARPLTLPHHYLRARTRWVVLELRDGSSVAGRLAAVTGGEHLLTVQPDAGAELLVPFAEVARGRIEVELHRAGDDAESGIDGPEDHDDNELED